MGSHMRQGGKGIRGRLTYEATVVLYCTLLRTAIHNQGLIHQVWKYFCSYSLINVKLFSRNSVGFSIHE